MRRATDDPAAPGATEKSMNSFGDDLLIAARQLYVYTEVVLARHTVAIGEIHDIRVRRAIEASNAVRSTLRSLRSHFPQNLRPSLDHVDELANYMHQSFNAALDYKRPYSSYNPFGLCVDVSQFNQRLVKEMFEPLVIDVFRMATMGMLLVHHFVLEFTLFACAAADDFCEKPMLSREYKESFSTLMLEILSYMTMYTDEIKAIIQAARDGGEAAAEAPERIAALLNHLAQNSRNPKIDHFIDFNETDLNELSKIIEPGHETNAMKNVRKLYFSFIVRSLQHYRKAPERRREGEEEENAADDLIRITQSQLFLSLKAHSNSVYTPQYRIFEDDNRRSSLLNSFMGGTNKPVYHYASKAWATSKGTHGEYVIKQVPGRVEVVPRSQVFVWRKRTEWTARDYMHAALTHGEVSLCVDLMFNMVPLIINNKHYRKTSSVDIKMVHMMMTRAFGIADVMTLLEPYHTEIHREKVQEAQNGLESIPDPHFPAAVAIQPMPKVIKEWMTEMIYAFVDIRIADENRTLKPVHFAPTHAKFHRPTSINVNDVLRPSNIDPLSYNVLWRRQLVSINNWEAEPSLALNSMFMLHYWEALIRIPTTVEQRTYGSDTLVVSPAVYGERDSLGHAESVVDFPIEYESSRDYQWKLMSTIKEFKEKYKKKPAPFLHPKSWLWNDRDWQKCDAATDVHGGTLLFMRTDNDLDDGDGDDQDQVISGVINDDPEHPGGGGGEVNQPPAVEGEDGRPPAAEGDGGPPPAAEGSGGVRAERAANAAVARADRLRHRGVLRTGGAPPRREVANARDAWSWPSSGAKKSNTGVSGGASKVVNV